MKRHGENDRSSHGTYAAISRPSPTASSGRDRLRACGKTLVGLPRAFGRGVYLFDEQTRRDGRRACNTRLDPHPRADLGAADDDAAVRGDILDHAVNEGVGANLGLRCHALLLDRRCQHDGELGHDA